MNAEVNINSGAFRQEIEDAPAHHLLRRHIDHFRHAAVDIRDAEIRIDLHDAFEGRFDDLAVLGLARAQRVLGQ